MCELCEKRVQVFKRQAETFGKGIDLLVQVSTPKPTILTTSSLIMVLMTRAIHLWCTMHEQIERMPEGHREQAFEELASFRASILASIDDARVIVSSANPLIALQAFGAVIEEKERKRNE
jgi:hypothetical protein